MTNLCIVVPVFNDWPSFGALLDHLDEMAKTLPLRVQVVCVDDGSTDRAPEWSADRWAALAGVEIVELYANVGHQRAIAIGLCVAVEEHDQDAVVVMDGDGEDPPRAIPTMLAAVAGMADFCVVAQRRRRTENLRFRASYLVYKMFFRLMTGKQISFGNFSMTSRGYARRLVRIPELWSNLAAGILRSKLPVTRVPIDRGTRYAGQSKMNFVSLVLHGLSGISVYAETIYARMLVFGVLLVALFAVAVPLVLVLRVFFPIHATPGWATTVTLGLTILFVQVLSTTLTSILGLMNTRMQPAVQPLLEYRRFIADRRRAR